MKKSPTNLSIGFHNISGKHSASLGCKLDNLVKLNNDIEVLAETNLKPSIKIVKSSNSYIWYEIDKQLFYNMLANIEPTCWHGLRCSPNILANMLANMLEVPQTAPTYKCWLDVGQHFSTPNMWAQHVVFSANRANMLANNVGTVCSQLSLAITRKLLIFSSHRRGNAHTVVCSWNTASSNCALRDRFVSYY